MLSLRNIAVFPAKVKVLPQFIFNSRDPIVMGVTIEAGVLRQGTPLCVPAKGVRLSNINIYIYVQYRYCFENPECPPPT